jgi:hypothetical protein
MDGLAPKTGNPPSKPAVKLIKVLKEQEDEGRI